MPDLIILFTYPFLPPTAPKKECMIKKSKMHFFFQKYKVDDSSRKLPT